MRVRITIESEQIAMPAANQLLLVLAPTNYIEIEKGDSWTQIFAAGLQNVWKYYTNAHTPKPHDIRDKERLVTIEGT